MLTTADGRSMGGPTKGKYRIVLSGEGIILTFQPEAWNDSEALGLATNMWHNKYEVQPTVISIERIS